MVFHNFILWSVVSAQKTMIIFIIINNYHKYTNTTIYHNHIINHNYYDNYYVKF